MCIFISTRPSHAKRVSPSTASGKERRVGVRLLSKMAINTECGTDLKMSNKTQVVLTTRSLLMPRAKTAFVGNGPISVCSTLTVQPITISALIIPIPRTLRFLRTSVPVCQNPSGTKQRDAGVVANPLASMVSSRPMASTGKTQQTDHLSSLRAMIPILTVRSVLFGMRVRSVTSYMHVAGFPMAMNRECAPFE